jgi:ATP-dependent helicase/nuclease subunit A
VNGPAVIAKAAARRSPTPEQEEAAAIAGRDVLLEAGAGTGKTGVMVDRYCRLVCDRGVDPEAILAFSFTDKAAAELRQRIRGGLERRAAEGSDRAGELLKRIGSAWITTIHGFCNRVLAGHPVAAGIDPGFRVLDAPEAERVARGAFDSALEAFLEEAGDGGEDLLATFDPSGLRTIVASLHAELRSRGEAEPRLPAPPPIDLTGAITVAAEATAAALAELKPDDPKRELLERAAETLESASAPTLEELCSLRLESKAKIVAAYREAIEAAIARGAEAGEGGVAYRQIGRLLELFSVDFAAAKERRAGLDFEDLQILAAALLERAEIGESYRTRFNHLMVDELQDTNRLQLRLIEALRGPGSELIAVGDELQSIYGFRHADLEVFREQRRLIAASPCGETMELSGNFRSRPEVIGAVNALGGVLFGDAFHPLRVGAHPSRPLAGEEPAVELLLTPRDGWDEEGIDLAPAVDGRTPSNCLAEARFVAERLRALADGGVERGEMVVLLRAFTHLDAYEDSLERAGLRPYVLGGRGYWSQQQVTDVRALLATIANPLDDQSLFGALASPAAGIGPDTLWLLRAAAGKKRHVWPAVEAAVAEVEVDLAEPERLGQIPAAELSLLRRFSKTLASLRQWAWRTPLAELIERAVTDTGYDLAVLMRPAGEARFANVRKLMRLAEGFEIREGRDLRGFLDFLASRTEIDSEAQAATAVEGHDGVRIMTVHNAKGLEFGVVAVPDLARSLLAGSRAPLVTVGREAEPRVGVQLRRLGAGSINLFAHRELCDEAKERDAAEGLRLFHVAATRARERLILSGVVKPRSGNGGNAGTPVIERIVDGLGIERETDSTVTLAPPGPRLGLDAAFEASEIAVRVNRPSPARAAELRLIRGEKAADRSIESGPAPLLERRTPRAARRPLSYTAIADFEKTAFGSGPDGPGHEDAVAHGIAVHSLLEWSAVNEWREPSTGLARRYAAAAGLPNEAAEDLLAPVGAWLRSKLFAERVSVAGAGGRAEVPLLLELSGTVLRGSIDLLVEHEGAPPLVIDYKTDRLGGEGPREHVARYGVQRDIYAIAVSEARRAREVEVAYVFLERPEEPVIATLGPAAMAAGRERLATAITRIHSA